MTNNYSICGCDLFPPETIDFNYFLHFLFWLRKYLRIALEIKFTHSMFLFLGIPKETQEGFESKQEGR